MHGLLSMDSCILSAWRHSSARSILAGAVTAAAISATVIVDVNTSQMGAGLVLGTFRTFWNPGRISNRGGSPRSRYSPTCSICLFNPRNTIPIAIQRPGIREPLKIISLQYFAFANASFLISFPETGRGVFQWPFGLTDSESARHRLSIRLGRQIVRRLPSDRIRIIDAI
ncbi:hypothetical protein DFH07DRAFT_523862 [Mycena maculata]|uniref:Uncharacterized protein n=1 Tax=Mycena maculata TaxID=230809 RepID=A0AAD7IZG4_9AGAR|nr:hypothetical protein DFH07DRAFT_523862 [Mycena maculata]